MRLPRPTCEALGVTPTLYAMIIANSVAMEDNLIYISGGGVAGWQAPAGTDCTINLVMSFGAPATGPMPVILRVTDQSGPIAENTLPMNVEGGDEDGPLTVPATVNVALGITVQMPDDPQVIWFSLHTPEGTQLGSLPLQMKPGPLPIAAD
jgi:hypothetical protein